MILAAAPRRDRLVVLAVLAGLYALAVFARLGAIALYGGQEDYTAWSMSHYFGGVTRQYLAFAGELLDLRYTSLGYPPGYPALLAAFRLLGISDLQAMRAAQAAIDALGVLPVYWLLRRAGLQRPLCVAVASVYAAYPLWVFGSIFLLGEFVSTLLVLAALSLALLWDRGQAPPRALMVASGFVLALFALVRPDLLLLPGLMAIWLLWRHGWRHGAVAAALLAAGFSLPIAAWGLHNKVHNGHWVFTTTGGGNALWEGLGEVPNEYGFVLSDEKAIEVLRRRGMAWLSPEADRYFRSEYLRAWREHPGFVLEVIGKRWKNVVFDSERFAVDVGPLEALRAKLDSWGLLLAFLALVLWRSSPAAVLIVSLPVAYALLSIGMTHWEARYVRYVHLSYLFSAALVLGWCVERLRARSGRLATIAMAVAVAVTAWAVAQAALRIADRAAGARLVAQLAGAAARGSLRGGYNLCSLDFKGAVPGATVARTGCELAIVTSPDPFAYQATATVPVPAGSAVVARFRGRLDAGGVNVGLLSGDGQRFLAQSAQLTPGEFSGELLGYGGSAGPLTVVVSNQNPKGEKSRATILELDVKCFPVECSAPASARDVPGEATRR